MIVRSEGLPRGVHALTTTRALPGASGAPYDRFNLGRSSGDRPEHVEANRARLPGLLGLPSPPLWLRQVHGVDVADADATAGPDEPVADASVTRTRGRVLAVLTADCLPIVLAAADGSEVAVAHAGWRGLAGGVIGATLAAMRAPPERIHAWLGPAIGAASYEVDALVRDAFAGSGSDAAFAATRPGHWRCDLHALARLQLAAAGIARVAGAGIDTFAARERFYSYRRDGATGRMATLAWLPA
ncbi:MAG TPA: peptidoglycan editing factor PgeF [Xanthomonadales bacterium]|nr:peptidoglycan editing factor PgeF [Xanthomonadales bacterium]